MLKSISQIPFGFVYQQTRYRGWGQIEPPPREDKNGKSSSKGRVKDDICFDFVSGFKIVDFA